jgi:protein TonB
VFDNLKYPEIAKKEGHQGRVYVSFVVDKKGKVSDVRIINGAHDSLNKEALRVIRSSPDWVPAKMGDINVPVTYTFPVIFKLR